MKHHLKSWRDLDFHTYLSPMKRNTFSRCILLISSCAIVFICKNYDVTFDITFLYLEPDIFTLPWPLRIDQFARLIEVEISSFSFLLLTRS